MLNSDFVDHSDRRLSSSERIANCFTFVIFLAFLHRFFIDEREQIHEANVEEDPNIIVVDICHDRKY